MKYYTNYPKEPIGSGNPYYRCSFCGVSDPQINGNLNGHLDDCEWATKEKQKIKFWDLVEDWRYKADLTLNKDEKDTLNYCACLLESALKYED